MPSVRNGPLMTCTDVFLRWSVCWEKGFGGRFVGWVWGGEEDGVMPAARSRAMVEVEAIQALFGDLIGFDLVISVNNISALRLLWDSLYPQS